MSLATYSDREAARHYYGVQESNPIEDGYQFEREEVTLRELADKGGRITRVRVLKEGRYCDVSYIHGVLSDGTPVRLRDAMQSCRYYQLKGEFIAWAKREGVFAKGIGLLDDHGTWSVLHG